MKLETLEHSYGNHTFTALSEQQPIQHTTLQTRVCFGVTCHSHEHTSQTCLYACECYSRVVACQTWTHLTTIEHAYMRLVACHSNDWAQSTWLSRAPLSTINKSNRASSVAVVCSSVFDETAEPPLLRR